jgi:hypothetical protein
LPRDGKGERGEELSRDLSRYLGRPFEVQEYRKQMDDKQERGVLAGKYLSNEGWAQTVITHTDVGFAALFLASDEAGRNTGEDIDLCAGETIG